MPRDDGKRPNGPGFFARTFGFQRAPFSLVFVVVYAVWLTGLIAIQDSDAPRYGHKYPDRFVEGAWADLQEKSRGFPTYGSHDNDIVHDYILDRVREAVANGSDAVNADEWDLQWPGRKKESKIQVDARPQRLFLARGSVFDASPNHAQATFFEANNVLVRLEGTDPSLGAVMVSSHFDSVATGHGTTDDGMGVASMLAMLRYVVETGAAHKRTLVFNFNNNEEYGLLGAEAFMRHDWASDVESFVNLEGAGAGGRAMLFRATDYGVARLYGGGGSPHASSIAQQAFDARVVPSETDYYVYKREGLRGLDIAFYRSRSLYHTARDSIQGASRQSLGHMFSSGLDALLALANEDEYGDATTPAVFFDVLGRWFVVLKLETQFALNVVGLVAGPLLVALLGSAVVRARKWDVGPSGWLRVVLALVVSVLLTASAVRYLQQMNPFVFVSQPYGPLLAAFAVFTISNYVVLGLASYLQPVHDQKLVVLVTLFVVSWVFLVYATVQISRDRAVGQYLATVQYYLFLAAVLVGQLGLLWSSPHTTTAASNVRGDEPTERTPLLAAETRPVATESSAQQEPSPETEPDGRNDDHDHDAESLLEECTNDNHQHPPWHLAPSYDWLLQFIIVVPVGLYFATATAATLLDAAHQTLTDSTNSLVTICLLTGAFAVYMGLLVMPFVHRLHLLAVVILAATGGIAAFNATRFPYTADSPHKLRFGQYIDFDDGLGGVPIVRVSGAGNRTHSILADLPSVKLDPSANLTCSPSANGLQTCQYAGAEPYLAPASVAANLSEILTLHVVNDSAPTHGPNRARLFVGAANNRKCYLAFNTTAFRSNDPTSAERSPVRLISVYRNSSDWENTEGHRPTTAVEAPGLPPHWDAADDHDTLRYSSGIEDLTLWKLDFADPGYRVAIEWIPQWLDDGPDNRLGVTATCEYFEYDHEVVIDGQPRRMVPAYDELLAYAPDWVTVTSSGGIVRLSRYIEL